MSTSSFSRHGAVDLSQLAQKAKQTASSARPGGVAPGSVGGPAAGGSYVVELTEQTFETQAIRPSMQHPVIVELYSASRGTPETQGLSDALRSLANASGGKFLLARLNADTAPQIVQVLGLRALPTVIALIGGQLAPLFEGAIPADQLAQVIDSVLKAAVTNGIVGRAEPVGGSGADGVADDGAEEAGPDPRFAEADAALERGDFAGAVEEFDKLLQANPNDTEAKVGKAQAGLLARATALDAQVVMLAASSPTAPVAVHLDAADLELASGRAEDAFARLIAQVKSHTGAERDQVRVRLLELFETLGNADPRVLKARRDLMTALF